MAQRIVCALAVLIALATLAHERRPADAQTSEAVEARGGVSLVPLIDRPTRVSGLHPYHGVLRVVAAADGLVVINELSLERYLWGLAEVPPDWPMEALRAQAIAARTYALWTLERPPAGIASSYGFDICASVECQVYAGAAVAASPDGSRWIRAVNSTRGRALLSDGHPILARYHSTSGGRTLDNEDVFDEAPLPYLRSVESPFEQASPLYRWRVVFRLGHLQRILEAAGWWGPSDGTLRAVRGVPSASGLHYPDVVLRGRSVQRRSAEELRAVLREHAPRLFPRLYPSPAPTASGRLPETLPSNRIGIATRDREVLVEGRGWGHGVGMSQWGAHGMALRGRDHPGILAHYYPGTALERVPPRSVEVGLDWGLDTVRVAGAFRIVDGTGRLLERRALGTWSIGWSGPGRLTLTPPRGFGHPPRVRLLQAPRTVVSGRTARLVVGLTAPALVSVIAEPSVRAGAPEPAARDAGRHTVRWRAPPRPGRYLLTVEASTGESDARARTVAITVLERPAKGVEALEGVGRGTAAGGTLATAARIALLLVVAWGAVSFVGTIKR